MKTSRRMLVRQWRLALALSTTRFGMTIAQLMRETGQSRSSLYRDLEVLRDAGAPITSELQNGEARHRFLRQTELPTMGLTTLQITALHLARAELEPLAGIGLVSELDAFLATLRPVERQQTLRFPSQPHCPLHYFQNLRAADVSHYAEAAVGVAVASGTVDTPVSLTSRAIFNVEPVVLNAFVPAYRALFVEGGALSGFFSPARCTANCDAISGQRQLVADSRQFLMPFVGVRYVSYYGVASQRARFRQRVYGQVYGHLLMRPFNSPSHPIYSYKGDELDRGSFGGRIGVDYPPPFCLAGAVLHTSCPQGGLALGYNPTPGFVFFEFHLSYLID